MCVRLRRLPKIIAAAWLVVALGLTVAVGPSLGWRGGLWLGVHHVLCFFGAGWELWVRAEPKRHDAPATSALGASGT